MIPVEITEDEINERAQELFAREHPNTPWAIVSIGNAPGRTKQASVGFEVRQKYLARAKVELENEAAGAAND